MKRIITIFALTTLLLVVFACRLSAQSGIIPTLELPANPSPYLTDWQSDANSIRLTTNLTLPLNRQLKLTVEVKTIDGEVVAATKPEQMSAFSLHQGINSFNAANIVPAGAISFSGNLAVITRRTGKLPEGSYEICVGFIDAETSAPFGALSCESFRIADIAPPVLICPADGAHLGRKKLTQGEQTTLEFQVNASELGKIEPSSFANMQAIDLISNSRHTPYIAHTETLFSRLMEHEGIFYYRFTHPIANPDILAPEPTPFSWLPPMPTPSTSLEYKLRIVPVLPGQNPRSAIVLNTETGKDIMLLKTNGDFDGDGIADIITYNIAHTNRFAWAVQAQDGKGNFIGKNNGWSETRTFDLIDNSSESEVKSYSLESFFDVFPEVEQPHEPCPYHYKKYIRNLYTLCKDGRMEMYGVYEIFTCSLSKGHTGAHEGVVVTFYVNEGKVGCSDNLKAEPLPPGVRTMTGTEIVKIPTKEIADKGDIKPLVLTAKEPCDHMDKTLLRTVVGSWMRGATTVRHITYHGTTVAWADVTWTRDIWNVFSVSRCTLFKDHAGAHKMGPGKEEFVKYSTVTEKVTYETGVPQVPPNPHWSDSLPYENPH